MYFIFMQCAFFFIKEDEYSPTKDKLSYSVKMIKSVRLS